MENLLNMDIYTFIKNKSIETFEKLNNTKFDEENIFLEIKKLNGLSNIIFRIKLCQKNSNYQIKIDSIFFKIFGRISVLVDRELETSIMVKLNQLGRGNKIYNTDIKTYRIEEFINDCKTLKREMMLDEMVLAKILNIFTTLNTIEDYQYYFEYVGPSSKNIFFNKLKIDKKTNIINLCLNKIRPYARENFCKFKEKYLKDKYPNFISEGIEKFNKIEYYLENLEDIFYKVFPNNGIFAINHNDGHPLNILTTSNYDKIYLIDYEYSCYNLIGFDMANYLIECFFLLEADKFPFYKLFTLKNFEELKELKYFEIYLKFIENFIKENGKLFESIENYSIIIEKSKTRDYYYRLIGLSSLLWFAFGVIYYDYDKIKSQTGFDYFNYSVDRLNVYDLFVKNEIMYDKNFN